MINKKQVIIASLLVIAAIIPATLFMQQTPQDTRSKASQSTTLTYSPNMTNGQPIEKNIGEPVAIDVYINPGTNLPSLVKLEMTYDASTFKPGSVPFSINTAAFPTTVEGPVVVDGKVLVSVSIGNESTKAIQQNTKVGTLNLIAKAATLAPSQISFGSRSLVLSLAKSDAATDNVLSTSTPTFVMVNDTVVPTTVATITPLLSETPTATPNASMTPTIDATIVPTATTGPTPIQSGPTITPTSQPTSTPMPTPTINPQATTLTFSLGLHGIGSSGDNANTDGTLSNKVPQNPSREITIFVFNDTNHLTATKSGLLTYDALTGNFIGTVAMGPEITNGDYTIRVKEGTHLRRLIPGIQHLTQAQQNIMPASALIAGDINNDNIINIIDYNILVDCYSDLLPAINCTETNKTKSDLNDNNEVNQFDYNLFLREITVQAGN